MAELSGPFDAGDLTEADWELMLSHVIDGRLSGLGASVSGSTVRGVDAAPGTYLVRGHWYKLDATKTLVSSANASGSARIDRGVLRLNRSANTVTLEVLTGTPGSSTPPALTDNSTTTERPWRRWMVESGATAVSGIVDESQSTRRGLRHCTSTNRPDDLAPGDILFETDSGRWLGWTGTALTVLREDSGDINFTVGAGWGTDGPCVGRRLNGLVTIDINLKRTGATLAETAVNTFATIPATLRPSARSHFAAAHITGDNMARLEVMTNGGLQLTHFLTSVPAGALLRVTATYIA